MNATIIGTGSCLGSKEYSNYDLWNWKRVQEGFDTNHWREKLGVGEKVEALSNADVFNLAVKQITGIEKRHFSFDKSAEELGAEAATIALSDAGISATDLDYIIVGIFTGNKDIPAPAVSTKDLIGAQEGGTLTHNEACSGFIYGLDVAFGKLQTGD